MNRNVRSLLYRSRGSFVLGEVGSGDDRRRLGTYVRVR